MSTPKKTITIILENCTAMRVIPEGYRIVAKDVKTGERFEMGGTPGTKPEFTKLKAVKKSRSVKHAVCDLNGHCH